MCEYICRLGTEVIHSSTDVAKFWRTEVDEFVIRIEYSDLKKKIRKSATTKQNQL